MTPDEMKARSRGQSVDMSPEAIAHRINIVSELRAAMIALERARPIQPDANGPDRGASTDRGDGDSAVPKP